MIDINTGEVLIESVPVTLGPKFMRRQLSALPVNCQPQIINGPHHSCTLGQQAVFGEVFFVVLYFYGQQLESIDLANASQEFGTSWNDWSEEKEMKRKEAHDRWLISQTGADARDYDWGSIYSDYDPRSSGSSIVIRYSWRGQPWRKN